MGKGIRPLAAVAAIAAVAGMAGTAQAANGVDTTALQAAVKVGNDSSGIRSHLKQLQLIANRPGNNGTRATATQGHEDSVKYVEQQLATAGGYWHVSEQPFSADVFEELAPPTLSSNPAASPAVGGEHGLRDDGRLRLRRGARGHADRVDRLRASRRRRPARPAPAARPPTSRRPRRQGRRDPARHLRLRPEGQERAGPRRPRRDHLQRGHDRRPRPQRA